MKYHVTRLTDYQVAEAFGDTLSLIYRDKMAELDEELQPVMNHLEQFNIPRYSDFVRWFARQVIPLWAKQDISAIDHMNKIKTLRAKMKKDPDYREKLNIEKARAVPITQVYEFKRRGTQVCCPFHPDVHPSASIKYNRLHCFQCGANHDGIGLFQKLNQVNFITAVNAINKL